MTWTMLGFKTACQLSSNAKSSCSSSSALLVDAEYVPLEADGHLRVLARHVEQELGGAPPAAPRRLHVLPVHLHDVEELLETRPEGRFRWIS